MPAHVRNQCRHRVGLDRVMHFDLGRDGLAQLGHALVEHAVIVDIEWRTPNAHGETSQRHASNHELPVFDGEMRHRGVWLHVHAVTCDAAALARGEGIEAPGSEGIVHSARVKYEMGNSGLTQISGRAEYRDVAGGARRRPARVSRGVPRGQPSSEIGLRFRLAYRRMPPVFRGIGISCRGSAGG